MKAEILYRHPASDTGQVLIELRCPKCGTVFEGWLWSLCGSGKRCPKCKERCTV